MDYAKFIAAKRIRDVATGIADVPALSPHLFDFQRDVVGWALRRGRGAIFADCGMGKTAMQLEWARHVPGRVLIVAPLAVGSQTMREARKFGMGDEVRYLRKDDGITRIPITNYEMLDQFDPRLFAGIVLDESSILKSYNGRFRNQVINDWGAVPFRLAATATPAPNDFMELGSHSEFLGVMSRTDMLAHFFVHDGGETQKWRLKGHAESAFWEWMTSWAVMIRKPSDLGYSDDTFQLPECHMHQVEVESEAAPSDSFLFAMEANTLQERQAARRNSVAARVAMVADLVRREPDEPWAIWCDLNAESEALKKAIPRSVEIKGSDDPKRKEEDLIAFAEGRIKVLITKPSIAGWGLNWQHCARMAFTGLSDSFEQFYQAKRRVWRFGQKRPVHCHVITDKAEGRVVANIQRKEDDARRMAEMMVAHMKDLNSAEIRGSLRVDKSYSAAKPVCLPSFL